MKALLAELRRHERDYPSLIHSSLCGKAAAEIERLRGTLIDLECAFSKTSEIPETPFTLHALDAIRRALGPAFEQSTSKEG